MNMRYGSRHIGAVRGLFEAVAGAIIGLPLGTALYYLLVIVFAEVIASSPVKLWLDFNPVAVAVLAMVAAITEFGLFRLMIRFGFTILARAFVILAVLTSLFLFTITAVRQNPLLPFYGQ